MYLPNEIGAEVQDPKVCARLLPPYDCMKSHGVLASKVPILDY